MQNAAEANEERALVRRFRNGDATALDMLFRRYYQRLCRDAQRFVSSEEAEDIVQDIFTTLLIRQQQWTIETTVRQYLHTAVRNRARDWVARSRRDERRQDTVPDDPDWHHPITASPEDDVLLDELAQAIETGLASCSTRVQEVLRLSASMRRYAEIGHALGIRAGTVHTLLARGRRRMRIYLRGQGWLEDVHTPPPAIQRGTRITYDGVAPAKRPGIPRDSKERSTDDDAIDDDDAITPRHAVACMSLLSRASPMMRHPRYMCTPHDGNPCPFSI